MIANTTLLTLSRERSAKVVAVTLRAKRFAVVSYDLTPLCFFMAVKKAVIITICSFEGRGGDDMQRGNTIVSGDSTRMYSQKDGESQGSMTCCTKLNIDVGTNNVSISKY